MPVQAVHPDLRPYLGHYRLIEDCLAGEIKVKSRTTQYLPKPNAADTSDENAERYMAYITRAVFYNVAERTLGGLVGQIFARDPIIEVDEPLQPVIDDATGEGVPATQLAKLAAEYVIGYGRAGVWADYPAVDGPVSIADQAEIRPVIHLFRGDNIINWGHIIRNGRKVLSLVVIREKYIKKDDGFTKVMGTRYRVLKLNSEGNYQVSFYLDANLQAEMNTIIPLDYSGMPMKRIPFEFIGPKTNDTTIDKPPMYDLCSLNIAHYRNSADYEESCFIAGQPTPYFTGLTQSWVNEVLKDRVELGSRAAILLPVGAAAGLLQAQANSMPFEAMKHKERQMVALGAKLVETSDIQRTATETSIDYSNETSILSAAADNVSDAFARVLGYCGQFIGNGIKVKFELSTEFDLLKLSPQERQQVIAEWQASALTFSEMRKNLRRAGIATEPDDVAKKELDEQKKQQLQELAETQPATTDKSPRDRANSGDMPQNPRI